MLVDSSKNAIVNGLMSQNTEAQDVVSLSHPVEICESGVKIDIDSDDIKVGLLLANGDKFISSEDPHPPIEPRFAGIISLKSMEKTKELQSFQFFKADVIPEKPFGQDVTLPTLHDFDISSAAYLAPRLYFAASKKNEIYVHEGESVIARFKPHNDKLDFIHQVCFNNQNFLITFGVDIEQPNDVRRSYLKFYEHESLMTGDFQNISNYYLNDLFVLIII